MKYLTGTVSSVCGVAVKARTVVTIFRLRNTSTLVMPTILRSCARLKQVQSLLRVGVTSQNPTGCRKDNDNGPDCKHQRATRTISRHPPYARQGRSTT